MSRKVWLLFFVSLVFISTLGNSILADPILPDCSSDQYISLRYPNELQVMNKPGIASEFQPFANGQIYPNDQRPTSAPQNKGYLWIPQEACGKSVDLLI